MGGLMHSDYSLERGKEDELLCASLLKQIGYDVEFSKGNIDIHDHIDLFINTKVQKQTMEFGVDVKANKIYDNTYRFVEVQNVKGGTGSLFGKADFIAFKEEDGFVFVRRQSLADFVSNNLDTSKIYHSFQPPYKHYLKQYRSHRKQNRQDIITLIKLSDIRKFKCFKIFNSGVVKHGQDC